MVGDQMFSLGVKGVSIAEKLIINGTLKGENITEKWLKNRILRARMYHRVRN